MNDAADKDTGAEARRGYERVGRLIYGMRRLGGPEGLRALEADPGVAPEAAERGAALADRYDMLYARFMRGANEVGDDEVAVLLGDAMALVNEVSQRKG